MRNRSASATAAALAAALVAALLPSLPAQAGADLAEDGVGASVALVSADPLGVAAGIGSSLDPDVSADGSRIVFTSIASNLAEPKSESSQSDVFLHDVASGETTLISTAHDGGAAAGASFRPRISADGTAVVFQSFATDLVSPPIPAGIHVFHHHVASGTTTLVSFAHDGGPADGSSELPVVSDDGNRVAYVSTATDLTPHKDLNGSRDVFVFDVVAGRNVLASAATAEDAGNGFADAVQISGDGSTVAFTSAATDLVDHPPLVPTIPGEPFPYNVFAYDVDDDTTELVSISDDGEGGLGNASTAPSLSEDGRLVAFAAGGDILVRDRNGGRTVLASRAAGSSSPANEASETPSISADGSRVAFVSRATDLTSPAVPATHREVYVHDLDKELTYHASPGQSAVLDADATMPALAADGSVVTFATAATTLAPIDDNGGLDHFSFDLDTGELSIVSESAVVAGQTGNRPSSSSWAGPAIAGDGSVVVFASEATDLAPRAQAGSGTQVYRSPGGPGRATFAAATTAAGEADGVAQVAVVRGGGTHGPLAVRVVSSDGSATAGVHYEAIDEVVTFPDGAVTAVVPVVLLDDGADGVDRTFTVALTDPQPGGSLGPVASTDITILDGTSVGVGGWPPGPIGSSVGLASVDPAGSEPPHAPARDGHLSADGELVVYTSGSVGLTSTPDLNGRDDVFLRDLTTGETRLISVDASGSRAANGMSRFPRISADGSTVVFSSSATDLVGPSEGPLPATEHVYAHDIASGVTTLVSVDAQGGRHPHHGAARGRASADGRRIVFVSTAPGLVAGVDPDGNPQAYLRDLDAGTTTLLSRAHTGSAPGNGPSREAEISADGTRVVFESQASDLTGISDENGTWDVFAHDVATGTTELVSVNADGTASADGLSPGPSSTRPRLSDDGDVVVFGSLAGDLTSIPETHVSSNVFVRDLVAGETTMLSATTAGTVQPWPSGLADISGDGSTVVFQSFARDLVDPPLPEPLPGDTPVQNVYAVDLASGAVALVTTEHTGAGEADGRSGDAALSADGSTVVFASAASDLLAGASPSTVQLYAQDLSTGQRTLVSRALGGASSSGDVHGFFAGYASPSIAADGSRVVFETGVTDLAATPTRGITQVFTSPGGAVVDAPGPPPTTTTTTTQPTTTTTQPTTTTTQPTTTTTQPTTTTTAPPGTGIDFPGGSSPHGFADVPAGTYFDRAVAWARHNSITTGVSPTRFAPGEALARGQSVTLLWRLVGSPSGPVGHGFRDVPSGSYFAPAVAWAHREGVTTGVSATRFAPGEPVSRAQVITLLWRLVGSPSGPVGHGFTDVPSGSYFAPAVAWAHREGVTTGVAPNRYAPGELVSRAQIVTLLWRMAGSPT